VGNSRQSLQRQILGDMGLDIVNDGVDPLNVDRTPCARGYRVLGLIRDDLLVAAPRIRPRSQASATVATVPFVS
jgi:hypothetical protein